MNYRPASSGKEWDCGGGRPSPAAAGVPASGELAPVWVAMSPAPLPRDVVPVGEDLDRAPIPVVLRAVDAPAAEGAVEAEGEDAILRAPRAPLGAQGAALAGGEGRQGGKHGEEQEEVTAAGLQAIGGLPPHREKHCILQRREQQILVLRRPSSLSEPQRNCLSVQLGPFKSRKKVK